MATTQTIPRHEFIFQRASPANAKLNNQISIHSEIAKTIWDELITHKGMKDMTKESMENNILNFNEAIQ
jgi:hypothetical protein